MHKFLQNLWLSDKSGISGVSLIPVLRLTTSEQPIDDFWKDIVYGWRKLLRKELDELNKNAICKFTSGVHFITFTSEPIKLLPFLMNEFRKKKGNVLVKKILNLKEFVESSDYDVIINCSGLGSKKMVPDFQMYPIRGQVSCIKANWVKKVILDESDVGNYIIPKQAEIFYYTK